MKGEGGVRLADAAWVACALVCGRGCPRNRGAGGVVSFAGAELFLRFVPGRRCLAVLVAGALFAASASLPALAFELFGRKFFEKNDTTPVVPDAQPYTLDFTVTGGDRALEKAIRGASSLARDLKKPPPGTAGLIARARGDYGRIVAALYGRGYYGGSIAIMIQGERVETMRPDAVLPKPTPVTVAVDPGPLFKFGKIEIDGMLPEPLTYRETKALDRDKWGLKEGEVARSGAILSAERHLIEAWRAARPSEGGNPETQRRRRPSHEPGRRHACRRAGSGGALRRGGGERHRARRSAICALHDRDYARRAVRSQRHRTREDAHAGHRRLRQRLGDRRRRGRTRRAASDHVQRDGAQAPPDRRRRLLRDRRRRHARRLLDAPQSLRPRREPPVRRAAQPHLRQRPDRSLLRSGDDLPPARHVHARYRRDARSFRACASSSTPTRAGPSPAKPASSIASTRSSR